MPITSESNISQVGDPRDGKDNNNPPPLIYEKIIFVRFVDLLET